MFNSSVIDVAIGLVFVFLLLSLICSAANEILESFLKKRASNLEKGIKELIGQGNSDFIEKFYNHGLINSLYRGKYQSAPWWKFWRKADLPSYIPARNFALALLDLRHTTTDLPENIQSALDAFQKNAGNDAAKLQHNIEDWFNSSMDRVSGWYKRYSQRIVLVMALIVAVLVNADCIQLAKRLSTNAILRQSIGNLADSATTKSDAPMSAVDRVKADLKTLDDIGLPLGWSHPAGQAPVKFADAVSEHWLGWLLTALAVSLGAPFWFDVLNKIIVIRSTVKPAEKSGPEASKDSSPPPPTVSPVIATVPVAAPAPALPQDAALVPPATENGTVVSGG
jgi:hypothetical protein